MLNPSLDNLELRFTFSFNPDSRQIQNPESRQKYLIKGGPFLFRADKEKISSTVGFGMIKIQLSKDNKSNLS